MTRKALLTTFIALALAGCSTSQNSADSTINPSLNGEQSITTSLNSLLLITEADKVAKPGMQKYVNVPIAVIDEITQTEGVIKSKKDLYEYYIRSEAIKNTENNVQGKAYLVRYVIIHLEHIPKMNIHHKHIHSQSFTVKDLNKNTFNLQLKNEKDLKNIQFSLDFKNISPKEFLEQKNKLEVLEVPKGKMKINKQIN